MIPDLGLIVGSYTFVRLLLMLMPLTPAPERAAERFILRGFVVFAMGLIAYAIADIIYLREWVITELEAEALGLGR